jgi:hypothetical protein
VAVFHDENMNGQLDKNMFGIPKEGYGFSNNPKKSIGPPKFADAKFQLDQPEKVFEIKLLPDPDEPIERQLRLHNVHEPNAENSLYA